MSRRSFEHLEDLSSRGSIRTPRVASEANEHLITGRSIEAIGLADADFRLNLAVDRQAVIKNLYSGRGQLLNTVTGKGVANTMDPGPYAYDPARAKALLAD